MPRLRLLLSLFSVALGSFGLPAVAHAAGYDPNGFRFTSANFIVHENAGQAVITITRNDASQAATAYYVAVGIGHPCGSDPCNATPPHNSDVPEDFGSADAGLAFPAGVSTESFTVPIIDHHQDTITKTFQVAIFNAWNEGIAAQSKAVVTILADDPTPPRDPNNPLELPVAPTNGDPL